MTVVVAEPVHLAPQALSLLQGVGAVRLGPFDRTGLLAAVADAQILMVRLTHKVDAALLAAAPGLRAVVSATTGVNHIDLDACAAAKVAVVSLRGETAFLDQISSTAEHAFGLLLALLRQTVDAHRQVVEGGFARQGRTGGEVQGKVLGLVGYGRLGMKMARYGQAFGMRVIACDPDPKARDVELVSLDRLLAQSDVISLHASHAPGQEVILGGPALAAIKPGAVLINTARGELLDESALLEALRDGRLAGAALDVAADETARPDPDPLRVHAASNGNLLLTPHIGGATIEALQKAETFAVRKLLTILEDHD